MPRSIRVRPTCRMAFTLVLILLVTPLIMDLAWPDVWNQSALGGPLQKLLLGSRSRPPT
jgi:hypothetical protein